MRYLFPPTLNTVRSLTKDADPNVPFRSPGLRQAADSTASTQCHIVSAERGSRSINSRIRFSVTILNSLSSHKGNRGSSADGSDGAAVLDHDGFTGYDHGTHNRLLEGVEVMPPAEVRLIR